MGPAPAVAAVRRAVRVALQRRADHAAPILVACSGGADSLALAAAVVFEAPKLGTPAGLITIDHGLQPGSFEQATRVANLGYELGFDPVLLVAVAVGSDGGPEGAARAARYRALGQPATDVLLGHTLDDQAETVLLGLGRGSGPRSIAGMSAVNGRWIRPLLGVRRATTRAACDALGIEYWTDPANEDASYQRVRLRTEVLPLLEEVLQGGVAEALARTATLMRDDLEALDSLAAALGPAEKSSALAVDTVEHLQRGVRSRVLRKWATAGGAGPLTADHVAALDSLVADWHGQDRIQLPAGVYVERRSGTLWLHPTVAKE